MTIYNWGSKKFLFFFFIYFIEIIEIIPFFVHLINNFDKNKKTFCYICHVTHLLWCTVVCLLLTRALTVLWIIVNRLFYWLCFEYDRICLLLGYNSLLYFNKVLVNLFESSKIKLILSVYFVFWVWRSRYLNFIFL